MPTNEQIISDFEEAVWIAVDESTEAGYNPTGFRGMITTHGGVFNASKQLLVLNGFPQGLMTLWAKERLDLSIEAIILRKCFSSIFTKEQLNIAKRRLTDLDFFKKQSYITYISNHL